MAYQAYAPWGTQWNGASGWGGYANPAAAPPQPYTQPGYPGYYDPASLYGAQHSYATAPIVSGPGGYFDLNPQAAYTRQTSPFATGEDPFSRFVRNQYGQTYQGYQAAAATNPSLAFMDYLQPFDQQYYQQRFMQQAPGMRGENNPLYGGGRLRWFLDNR